MEGSLSHGARKVQDALDRFGLQLEVVELPSSTRTAREAAASIGCEVASIAKSLVFIGKMTGNPLLVITGGSNRVELRMIEPIVGEEVGLADPQLVLDLTGFAVGGVPPLGFPNDIPVYIDEDLMDRSEIWAAAGTPFSVFRLDPVNLQRITGGLVIRVY